MFKHLFSFKGRASRSDFWSMILLSNVLLYAPLIVFIFSGPTVDSFMNFYFNFMIFLVIAIFWMYFAVSARRLHDLDRSGWWNLLTLPFAPLATFWLGCFSGTQGPNRFGESVIPVAPAP